MPDLIFVLISDTLKNIYQMNRMETSYKSGLSQVLLDINKNKFLKGKGIWKFDNSISIDKGYIKIVKK